MPQPGFTAGACLRKDFTFSEERSPAPGMLLAVSRVHESVPLFIVEGLKRRLGSLRGRKVAVLGLAFKADTDDERDSLAHKLIRLLERELADVAVHDPHVATPTQSFDEAVTGADAVIVATNHPEFCGRDAVRRVATLAGEDVLVVDPWNCFGAGQVFAYATEVATLVSWAASSSPEAPARSARRLCVACCATPTGRSASPTTASRRSGCARAARSPPSTCARSSPRASRRPAA